MKCKQGNRSFSLVLRIEGATWCFEKLPPCHVLGFGATCPHKSTRLLCTLPWPEPAQVGHCLLTTWLLSERNHVAGFLHILPSWHSWPKSFLTVVSTCLNAVLSFLPKMGENLCLLISASLIKEFLSGCFSFTEPCLTHRTKRVESQPTLLSISEVFHGFQSILQVTELVMSLFLVSLPCVALIAAV